MNFELYCCEELIKSGPDIRRQNPDGTEAILSSVGKNVYVVKSTYICDGVSLGDDVQIFGRSSIGQGSRIGSDVTIYSKVNIGNNVDVGSGNESKKTEIYSFVDIGDFVSLPGGSYIGTHNKIEPYTVINEPIRLNHKEKGHNCTRRHYNVEIY